MPDMTKDVLFEIVNRDIFQNDAYEDIVVEYDNDSRRITFSIYKYYDEVDLSTKSASVRYVNALGQYDEYMVRDLTTKDNYIYFTWMVSEKVLAEFGEIEFDILFFDEKGYKWHTKPATLKVEKGLIEVEYTVSAETSDLYSQWRIEANQNLKQTEEFKNEAQQAATSIGTSATDAATSASNASKSAQQAANSATEAKNYRDSIGTSAQQAANSATLSKSWAVGGTGTRTNEDADNAKYYAEQIRSIANGSLGYYPTPELLQTAYPTSNPGFWAIIGSTNTIWIWSVNSSKWVNTSVEADSVYTKTQTDTVISKIAPMYTATFSVTGWSNASTAEKNNGYSYKQTATLTKDVSTSPDVTSQSQFMTAGAFQSTGVVSTDKSLMDALVIINSGYTVSGSNQVTTLVTEKPTVDISVKWAIKG